jgi:hypothetical protein
MPARLNRPIGGPRRGASAFALRFVYEPFVAPQRVAACQPFATAADVVIRSDARHRFDGSRGPPRTPTRISPASTAVDTCAPGAVRGCLHEHGSTELLGLFRAARALRHAEARATTAWRRCRSRRDRTEGQSPDRPSRARRLRRAAPALGARPPSPRAARVTRGARERDPASERRAAERTPPEGRRSRRR